MDEKRTMSYSEAFKLSVVGEIESGKHRCAHAAAKAYRIPDPTVRAWLRRYGRSDLIPRKVLITTMEEHDEKKALRQRVRELEKALADTHMKGLLSEAYFEIACQRLGQDPAEFKKKAATKLSATPTAPERSPR